MEQGLLIFLAVVVITFVILRVLKSKRQGIAALKIEIIYMMVYCFFGGFLSFLAISKFPSWPYVLLFLAAFWAGLLMRAFPLFRQLNFYRLEKDETI